MSEKQEGTVPPTSTIARLEAEAAEHAAMAAQHEIAAAAAASHAFAHERDAQHALDETQAHEREAQRLLTLTQKHEQETAAGGAPAEAESQPEDGRRMRRLW